MFRCLHAGDLDAVVCPELVADGGLSHYRLSVHEACSRISGLGRKAHYNPRIIESAVLEGDSTDQHDRREHCSFRFTKRLVRGTAWLRSDVRHVSPLTLCLHHPRNDLDAALALAIQAVPCSCRRVARRQTYRSAALWRSAPALLRTASLQFPVMTRCHMRLLPNCTRTILRLLD